MTPCLVVRKQHRMDELLVNIGQDIERRGQIRGTISKFARRGWQQPEITTKHKWTGELLVYCEIYWSICF
jgi:hypothetical protein